MVVSFQRFFPKHNDRISKCLCSPPPALIIVVLCKQNWTTALKIHKKITDFIFVCVQILQFSGERQTGVCFLVRILRHINDCLKWIVKINQHLLMFCLPFKIIIRIILALFKRHQLWENSRKVGFTVPKRAIILFYRKTSSYPAKNVSRL